MSFVSLIKLHILCYWSWRCRGSFYSPWCIVYIVYISAKFLPFSTDLFGVLASESCQEAWRPSPQKVDPPFRGQRQRWRPQEDPLAVHCLCVCSGIALLGDVFGVSRSMEHQLLSVMLIYPRIFFHVFIAYCLLVGFLYVWLYSAICSCVLVVLVKLSVLAKWLASTPLMTPSWGEEIISTKPRWKSVSVCIFLLFGMFMLLCVSPGPTQYIFRTPVAWYSLYVLKVRLNTKQTNYRFIKELYYNKTGSVVIMKCCVMFLQFVGALGWTSDGYTDAAIPISFLGNLWWIIVHRLTHVALVNRCVCVCGLIAFSYGWHWLWSLYMSYI